MIAQRVRFLVCLPTPLTVVDMSIRSSFRSKVLPLYQDAIFRSLRRVQDHIPPSDLAIQWDLPHEFALLEGKGYFGEVTAGFKPVFEGIIERLVQLGQFVAPGVELGFHFCYGK